MYGSTCAAEVLKIFMKWIETFAFQYDTELNMTYVKKVKDELTKNHQDTDIGVISGFMPQVLGPDGLPHKTVADPGFPVGEGRGLPRRLRFVNLYVKN